MVPGDYTGCMHARRLSAAFMVVAILLLLPVPTRAAGGEQIVSFASEAVLSSNSQLDVRETIDYDFGAGFRHGIFRTIPLNYVTDDGKRYQPQVTFGSALQDGLSATAQQTTSENALTIKLGDAARTITGRHTYVLTYRIAPIMQPGDGHDVLRFNVTGNGWTVPILSARARLQLPGGVNALNANCFTGAAGSKATGCSVTSGPSTVITQTAGPLAPGQGLSVFADLPTGAVTGYLQPYVEPKPNPYVAILPFLSVLGILAAIGTLIRRYLGERALRRSRLVIAQYEPPDGLRPAELGLLNDNRSGMPEVTATLIDLAVCGHLRIEQTQKKGLLSGAEYNFTRLANADPVEPFEQTLLDAVFAGQTKAMLEDLDRTKTAAAVKSMTSEVGERLKGRGWYIKPPTAARWVIPIMLIIVAGFILNFSVVGILLSASTAGILTTVVICAVSLGLSLIAIKLLRRQDGMTPSGADEYAKVKGFREYLDVAEKARLDFSDAPNKTPERFNKLLPFAVALGVEKAWAKQFEGIDVAPATGWYSGYDPSLFGAAFLASSLSSDFSKAVAANFTPVSSSGSSSGGFSGGGFGGGGGGSW